MSKIYVAGKVTGLPRKEVLSKFNDAADYLEVIGYDVVNPVKIVPEHADHTTAMRICIKELATCDAVYLLHDWDKSPGAIMEHKIATMLKITLIHAL